MKELTFVLTTEDSRTNARDLMEKHELNFAYVTNEKNVYVGYVTLEDCNTSNVRKLDSLIRNDIDTFYYRRFIKDLVSILTDTDFEVPIVDSRNRLKGTVCYSSLLEAIS